MPFNDKKEILKDETYCIGTLSIDGETIEIFGGFKKENKEERLKGGTLCIDGEEIEILGGFKKEQLELSLLLEELIYTLKKWGETWES